MDDPFIQHFLEIRIGGCYQVCERLGSGTFGEVYIGTLAFSDTGKGQLLMRRKRPRCFQRPEGGNQTRALFGRTVAPEPRSRDLRVSQWTTWHTSSVLARVQL